MNYEMPRFVIGATTALGTGVDIIPLVRADERNSSAFANRGAMSKLVVVLDTIVTATSATWYLAADAVGDVPLTPSITTDIVAGQTGGPPATKGGIVALINCGYAIPADYYVDGTVYLVIALDAGSANGTPWLEFYS